MRILVRIEVLIHILQHVFYAYLLAITDAPHTVKLQSLDDCRFKNEYSRGTRTTNKINAMRVKVRYRFGENTVMPCVEHAYTVRPYQGCTVFVARADDELFQFCSRFCLFAEAC